MRAAINNDNNKILIAILNDLPFNSIPQHFFRKLSAYEFAGIAGNRDFSGRTAIEKLLKSIFMKQTLR